MVQANETKALEEARAALLVSIEEDESEDFWKTYRGPRFVQAQARRMCQDPEAAAENTDILYFTLPTPYDSNVQHEIPDYEQD